MQVEGSILSSVSLDHIYYRKLTSAYTIGYASEGRVKSAVSVIGKADAVCSKKGTVAFVDDVAERAEDISLSCFETYLTGYDVKSVTKEELSEITSEYLIGVTTTHSYYNAMDRYAVILRNQNYTVLVKKDSEQYTYFEENGLILSDGTRLSVQALVSNGQQNNSISLEMGSYEYECQVRFDNTVLNRTVSDAAGSVIVQTKDEVLAEREINSEELKRAAAVGNELLVSIPLNLRAKKSGIYCTVKWKNGSDATAEPTAIVLTSEKYQYGQEESKFSELTEKIEQILSQNKAADLIPVAVVQTSKVVNNRQIAFDRLQEMLPECRVSNMDFDEAHAATEDMLLLTYGLSKHQFNLLSRYSVLAHAGKYTLWVKNDGQLFQQATQAGLTVLNSGRKLSLESIAVMSGEKDAEVVNLPKAIYNVTVELETEDLETDDTVEVTLLRDKTDEEIASEVKELMDAGYTKKEAIRAVDRQAVCGTGTYNAYEFDGAKKIVSIRTNVDKAIENLCVEAFSWHGKNIEGAIIWIEIA